jgi:ATP-binding cassette subfamily B protein/subfamily B ATP-binding cassette protein MsbA
MSVWGSLKSVEPSIDRVLEVLDQKDADDGGRPMNPLRAAGALIEWSDVTFGYSVDAPVLRNVSLRVEPGKMLALVGTTGAGKSTLVSLVPRFFDPWHGKVMIDGQDVREVRLNDLRGRISVVLQEPFLLPLSVAENIAYGRVGAGRAEIEKAAAAANADGFIRKLPQGYETVIGERGASLSGGERHRLAIARAILKDAPILIMDEPTSALDAQTEASVMEALGRLMAGRTCIVIAHRLSTVRRADVIAVVQEGRVVETGRHEELIARGGVYARLCELQFGERGVTV